MDGRSFLLTAGFDPHPYHTAEILRINDLTLANDLDFSRPGKMHHLLFYRVHEPSPGVRFVMRTFTFFTQRPRNINRRSRAAARQKLQNKAGDRVERFFGFVFHIGFINPQSTRDKPNSRM